MENTEIPGNLSRRCSDTCARYQYFPIATCSFSVFPNQEIVGSSSWMRKNLRSQILLFRSVFGSWYVSNHILMFAWTGFGEYSVTSGRTMLKRSSCEYTFDLFPMCCVNMELDVICWTQVWVKAKNTKAECPGCLKAALVISGALMCGRLMNILHAKPMIAHR